MEIHFCDHVHQTPGVRPSPGKECVAIFYRVLICNCVTVHLLRVVSFTQERDAIILDALIYCHIL